jgi:hypothetical protein
MRLRLDALALLALSSAALAAESPAALARRAQLEDLRGEIAAQLQLQAADLLDELVYGWTQQPPFTLDTPVVLAGISVPVGFGTGLEAYLENHFATLLGKNPRTRVLLAHCPGCSSIVVHSGAKATLVTRGVDNPAALAAAGSLSGSRHALFLDFEAEGAALVLRARVTVLEPALPIVVAKTLSTTSASPALLRAGDRLKSAAEARQEYLDALEGRGIFVVPVRLGMRSYAPPAEGQSPVGTLPFVWLQVGLEAAFTQARAWTGSVSVGATWMPELHVGWLAQARVARLLSGEVTSLTRPDLYGFLGVSVISLQGRGALVFSDKVPTIDALAGQVLGTEPHAIFAGFQVGFELRVKNRIGAGVYLESSPALNNAPAIGKLLDLGLVQFHAFGAEVSFCF